MGRAEAHLRSGGEQLMARRHIAEEPVSRLAIWARRMALFSLAAALLSIVIVRSGLLEIGPALVTFAGALACAVIALVLALAAFVVIWKHGLRGLGHSLGAIAIGLTLLAYPTYLSLRAYKLPRIHDITTDPVDPPRYEVLARIRPRNANSVNYEGLTVAQEQHAAYPEIEALEDDTAPQAAFTAALGVITKRRWLVVDQRPPQPPRREGRIEAVARTPIMGFRDDVVVRVRPTRDGSRIDLRSSSRYGSFDFGTNAARVRALIDDIDEAIGALKPDQPERPTTPAPKKSKGAAKGGQAPTKR
jgi:Protein of unknown function (DUF1499)